MLRRILGIPPMPGTTTARKYARGALLQLLCQLHKAIEERSGGVCSVLMGGTWRIDNAALMRDFTDHIARWLRGYCYSHFVDRHAPAYGKRGTQYCLQGDIGTNCGINAG
jgi:hypothetical protein